MLSSYFWRECSTLKCGWPTRSHTIENRFSLIERLSNTSSPPAKRELLYPPLSLQYQDSVWLEPVQVLCILSYAVSSHTRPLCCVEKTPVPWNYLRLPAFAIFLLLRLLSLEARHMMYTSHLVLKTLFLWLYTDQFKVPVLISSTSRSIFSEEMD